MPEQAPTLRDMIKEAAGSGLTYDQLAQRAKRRGAKTSGSYLNNIVLGNVSRLPTPENLRGIAWALDVPYERVRQAAIAQWLPAEDASADRDGRSDAELAQEMRELRDRGRALATQAEQALARYEGRDSEAAS